MRPLSEIMDSIRTGIQVRETKVQTKQVQLDPEWEAAKDYVDSLPTNYIALAKKNGIKPQESLSGKLKKNQFDLGNYKGMPLELVEYTKQDGSVAKVWYALMNNKKGSVYQRDL